MAERTHGTVSRVREVIRKYPEFGPEYLADCGTPEQVRGAIRYLRRTKEIETVENGGRYARYRRLAGYEKRRQPEKLRRIFRCMHVKGSFSALDIAKVADVTRSYAEKTARYLTEKGHLEVAGHGKNSAGARVKIYRVRHRDRFQTEVLGGRFTVTDITVDKKRDTPLCPPSRGESRGGPPSRKRPVLGVPANRNRATESGVRP